MSGVLTRERIGCRVTGMNREAAIRWTYSTLETMALVDAEGLPDEYLEDDRERNRQALLALGVTEEEIEKVRGT